MTVRFIDLYRQRWPVAVICRVLGFSERSYYARKCRSPSVRSRTDARYRAEIRRVWENNYRAYGAPRVWRQLGREGHLIARCTVERLMAEMGIRGVRRGKRHRTTIPAEGAQRAQDLVGRRFVADRPGQLWVADLTYVPTGEGFHHVAFITDVFSRKIVGYQLAAHLRASLVTDSLEMALAQKNDTGELICHSDAGNQYTSLRYTDRLLEAGIAASIGTVGDSYDNALAESLHSTYKAELVSLHGPWPTRRGLETDTIKWIGWYNHQRLHSSIGNVTPAEKETDWYR
ncbi:MAG: IS3 family transposase [Actinobacteria bacterium]|nr:IS3 family transposase [Actinomycetota bacterium]